MKSIAAVFLIVFSFGIVADAQIKLKFPKLPKVPKPTGQTGQQPGDDAGVPNDIPSRVLPGEKASNRQLVIDDGFTFFDAEPVEEYSAPLARMAGIGWHLRSNLRMMGTVPNRSGFNLVVSKAGKELAKIRCEGVNYRKAEDPVPQNRALPQDDYLMTSPRGCENKAKIIKETGKMDVAVYYFDGSSDQEKLLRTYKIDVHEATRVRGLATKPVVDVPHYYIQRHAETPAAILLVRPMSNSYSSPNYYRIAGDGDFHSEVEIYFNISPKRQVDRLKDANLRCSVNGSPLNFPGSGDHADQVRLKQLRVETAIYTDRLAPEYKRANEYMDEVSFALYQARLPLLRRGDQANFRLGMLDKPGNWECSIRSNGEVIRTFRWKVDGGGVTPHPEQSSGNINLYYGGTLIEAEVQNGGHEYDHRLLPLPNDGLFYGISWKTAEGKAAAAKVPTKGRAFHVPSNKAK